MVASDTTPKRPAVAPAASLASFYFIHNFLGFFLFFAPYILPFTPVPYTILMNSKLIITGIILFLIAIPIGWLIYQKYPIKIAIISPQGQVLSAVATTPPPQQLVYGFLPYWLINKAEYIRPDLLTHLAYFGIAIDDQGQIETNLSDGTKELGLHRIDSPEVTKLVSQMNTLGRYPILVVRAMDNDRIAAATDPEKQEQVINTIITIMRDNHFRGLNIDFEPVGDVSPELQDNYTLFITKLNQKLDQLPPDPLNPTIKYHLSIDIYASAYKNPRLWNLPELAKQVDHIIVMAYDFSRPTSPQSSPHAPIHGAPDLWKFDINDTINNLSKKVPAEQLILGVPYYGYQWPAKTNELYATAANNGSLATYSYIRELLPQCRKPDSNCRTGFDTESLTPYLIYPKTPTTWQHVWFENEDSLHIKYLYAKSVPLGGIGIWALGYDAPYSTLWDLIQRDFFADQ